MDGLVDVDLAVLVLEAHAELEAGITDLEMDDLDLERGLVFDQAETSLIDLNNLAQQTGLLREITCELDSERNDLHIDLDPIKELKEVVPRDHVLSRARDGFDGFEGEFSVNVAHR